MEGRREGDSRVSVCREGEREMPTTCCPAPSSLPVCATRDMKPANILLTTAGGVKITDFGSSKGDTMSETFVGTTRSACPPILHTFRFFGPAMRAPTLPRTAPPSTREYARHGPAQQSRHCAGAGWCYESWSMAANSYGVNRMVCSGVEDSGGAQSRCMLPFSHP
jgi:serine/threonine protein kinase